MAFRGLKDRRFLGLVLITIRVPVRIQDRFDFREIRGNEVVVRMAFGLDRFFRILRRLFALPIVNRILFFDVLLRDLGVFVHRLRIFKQDSFLVFLKPFNSGIHRRGIYRRVRRRDQYFQFFCFGIENGATSVPGKASFKDVRCEHRTV